MLHTNNIEKLDDMWRLELAEDSHLTGKALANSWRKIASADDLNGNWPTGGILFATTIDLRERAFAE